MPYQNVYEPRPTRETKPLTNEEQKKLESELSNLRDTQNKRAIPPEPPAKAAANTGTDTKTNSKAPSKTASKTPPKKMAVKPKPADASEKKSDDAVVPDKKGPAPLKLIN